MSRPRVFEEGTVTLVVGPDGFTVYAGAQAVEACQRVALATSQGGRPALELGFPKGPDPASETESEQGARTASRIPWIRVSR